MGETFSCTVCANNDLNTVKEQKEAVTAARTTTIDGVRITAEMQTPSSTVALNLHSPNVPNDDDTDPSGAVSLEPGQTIQHIVRFDLKEPGNHVLAVTVTYTENISPSSSSPPSSSSFGRRVRTFRKLYQFLAEPSLAVRTKTIELATTTVVGDRREVTQSPRYLLEAQLENMSQDLMTLEVIHHVLLPPTSLVYVDGWFV